MKIKSNYPHFLLILLIVIGSSNTKTNAQGVLCGSNDTFMTNSIAIVSGINYKISGTTHFGCGYGGNSYYTTPNNNVDSFWIVSHLSTMYNPRANSTPFAYTGRYLVPGDNPYILCTMGNPVQQFWSDFTTGGNCSAAPTTNNTSQWLSIYSDGGGQDTNPFDSIYDGYEFDRCFALCQQDSIDVNLNMLADDIIDSVMIDNAHLYITPVATNLVKEEFKCDSELSVHVKIQVPAGRHFLRIWVRDIFHGHLGFNIYGSITATAKNFIKPQYDDRCSLTYTTLPILGVNTATELSNIAITISPNPSNGVFRIAIPAGHANSIITIYDCYGRKCIEQNITNTENSIIMNNYPPGIYFARCTTEYGTINKRIIIQ